MEGQLVIPESVAAERFADVMASADTVADMLSVCWSMIVSNPFLCALVAAGLLGVGVRVWLSARRASH